MKNIETVTKVLAFGFVGALLCLPACDKGAADKGAADKAGADKAEVEKPEADKPEADKPAAATPEPAGAAAGSELAELDGDGRVDVVVDASGYHPAEVRAPADSKITLAFTRTTEQGCGQDLVIKAMDIKRALPLNEVVEIEVVVPASGELGFACGMNMYQGKVTPKA